MVASDSQLRSFVYREILKDAVRVSAIPQREWPTVIQNSLLLADMMGISFIYADGRPYPIPFVDEIWGQNIRYVRDFLASRRCINLEKDRLIDLHFRTWAYIFTSIE